MNHKAYPLTVRVCRDCNFCKSSQIRVVGWSKGEHSSLGCCSILLVVARETKRTYVLTFKLELEHVQVGACTFGSCSFHSVAAEENWGSSLVWVGAQTKYKNVKRSWSLPFILKKKRFSPFGFPRENIVSFAHLLCLISYVNSFVVAWAELFLLTNQ